MPNEGGSQGDGSGGSKNLVPAAPLPTQFGMNDDWNVYSVRIGQYFVAYGIENDERKRAILLTSLSDQVFSTVIDLCFPNTPESQTYKSLCEIMKKHFAPIVSVYCERATFYKVEQKVNESVTEFVARLKKAALFCRFGNYLDLVLRDKFVSGLLKGPIFEKVCEQEHNAPLETCVEAALKKELAIKQRSSKGDVWDVCKVEHMKQSKKFNKFNKPGAKQKQSSPKVKNCFACGESNHLFRSCKYKSVDCKKCKVKGHLAKVCKSVVNKHLLNLECEEDFGQISLYNITEHDKNSEVNRN